jgi:Cd(II)/Pb(II)-responsive transcriptional regulator
MKIGELAQRTGISIETIRFYEAQGLLPPAARAANNYRVYTPEHVEQLAFIAKCRSLDMAHTEIRRLLELQANPQASCEEINNLLDEHLRHVEARIAELTDLKGQIEAIGQRCTTAVVARRARRRPSARPQSRTWRGRTRAPAYSRRASLSDVQIVDATPVVQSDDIKVDSASTLVPA